MPGGWETLGLAGDPAPGDPGQVRALATRLLDQAKLAEDNTARLSTVSGNSPALNMRGDYAAKYAEALQILPDELAKLGRAYRGAGTALNTYAGSLEQAKTQAGGALRQGQAADEQYQGALREVRAQLPATAATGSLAEVESAVSAADPAVQAAVRPAVTRARNADADRTRARRIAEEAAGLRGQAESRAVREIEQALQGSGIQNKSWLEKAWETVSTPFRSWDDFVNLARNVAMVAGIAVLIVGTGGLAGAILLGAAVVAGAVVFADSLNKYRQGRASLGQVVLDGIGMFPGGRQVGMLAQGAKAVAALGGLAAGVRAGGGTAMGLFRTAGIPAGATAVAGAGLRGALAGGAGRAATAAGTAWQKARQFFSKDPVHFPTGTVLLPQHDVELPGVLPLVLERTHLSSYQVGRWFGPSWASTVDQRLEIDEQGVCLALATGALLTFPHPGPGEVLPDAGPRLLLTRDPDGEVYRVTDPATGHTLHFTEIDQAEEEARVLPLTAVTDRNGNRIDLRYTGGVLAEVSHSGGYHLDIETHAGLIVAIRLREAGQTLVAYRYDEHRNLTEVINSSGLPLRFDYDEHGRLTRWIDRIGTWYAYTYDEQGRCVQGSGSDGIFDTRISYADGLTTARDSLGHETTYHYNDLLQVVREVNPLGAETRYTWDPCDRLLSETDPLGRTTTYTYDARSLLTVTRPDGARRTFTRDALDQPATITDFDGTCWQLTYDERGNLTADPRNTYTHDEHGHLTTVTDALGQVTTIENDPAGLPITVTDPLGAVTRYERDAFGRITAITDPLGNLTRQSWTVEGRPAARTLPGGATERWTHDAEGNLTGHTDPLGRITRLDIGPFDLPKARTTPDGARTEFTYDTELRLTQVTNPLGLTWHYTYDPAGARTGETDFNDRTLAYRFDAAGRLAERVNGAGQTTRYTRDVLGQVVEERSGDRVTTFAYDLAGRLVQAANPETDLRLVRDDLGRITEEICNGRSLASAYDATGRRVLRRTPSGAESTWRYDEAGHPAALHTAGQTMRFTHDQAGRQTSLSFGAGVSLTQDWDPDSRLRDQTLRTAKGRVLQRRTYAYGPDGGLTDLDDLLAGRRHYDLDPAGRVTTLHGLDWTERYTYDAAGQITDARWPSSPDVQGPRTHTGTQLRRAGNVRYEYDAQGRVVLRRRKGLSAKPRTWRYTWDADDRLTELVTPDGSRWRYVYDPLGRRVAKERHDGTDRVDFTWDGFTLAEQTTAGRATVWEWEPAAVRPLTQAERVLDADQEWVDQQFYAITTDLAGTPAELIDPEGTLAWRAGHTLWGSVSQVMSAGPHCPLRFPGQYADEESDLHYNLFRYYDPASGRYTSSDPLGLSGGWNPYSYVVNPATWLDPLGLSPYPARGEINPNEVRFTQNNAGARFSTGQTIEETAEALRNGSLSPADLPPIRLFEHEGHLYSFDNRRLIAFQKAGLESVPYRMASPSEIHRELVVKEKFSTATNGVGIQIRGGEWHGPRPE
ncbi:RHS repeat-associated core domain-containing protein [Nonomuraea rubra]|uniref:RHS repeat-associated core domain-containing protein n=1 Tax=Nonomuraea rubra TaxID=46180 RepID=UPI003404007D